MRSGPITVGELAAFVGGSVVGDSAKRIASCGDLVRATGEQVSFLSNAKYTKHLDTTQAGCVILAPDVASKLTRKDLTAIVAKDPYFAFRQAIVKFYGFRAHPGGGISSLASVHTSAKIAASANVQAFASVGENVTIGENAQIYSGVTIMAGSTVGKDCILYPAVTVYDNCVIGDRVILHSGCVIGVDGYGFATNGGVHHKIPQVGNVILEEDVEVAAGSVIERAVLDSTVIGKGTKIGNSVVIGHNCRIGEHNLLVSQVGIAGSASTGKYVVMAGQVGVAGHLHIADMTRIAAQSGVMGDIEEPGQEHGGSPAMEAKHARRVYLNFVQLPELAKRVRELEAQIKKLQAAGATQTP